MDVWPWLAAGRYTYEWDSSASSYPWVKLFQLFSLFIFLSQPVDKVLMAVREEPLLEFHCKQMDHFVGLQFSQNFHFALMVHLVKGMGLPS